MKVNISSFHRNEFENNLKKTKKKKAKKKTNGLLLADISIRFLKFYQTENIQKPLFNVSI